MNAEFGRGFLVGVIVFSLIGAITYGAWQVIEPLKEPAVSVAKADATENEAVLNCSFCGKTQDKVGQLIAGPSVYICNECVGLCNEILAETNADWAEAQCKVMLKSASPLSLP